MIKAIDTVYNGYRFRSRLEARWAVFFDALGIEYKYELEGYDLDGLWYLPDFYIPSLDAFCEIKANNPTQEETDKAGKLSLLTGKSVYLLFGDCWYKPEDDGFYELSYGGWDNCREWCQCPKCGLIGLEFNGYADRLPCSCDLGGDYCHPNTPIIVAAFELARQARFEHGEIPKVTPLSYADLRVRRKDFFGKYEIGNYER